jgi:glycosyltransferase involved in cell wall biosynthesis
MGHLDVLNHLRQHPPDLVHWQWARLPYLDRYLVQAIARMGIPQVYTVHDVVPLFQATPSPALQTLYGQMQAFILHSKSNCQDFLTTFPTIDATRLHVIPLLTLPHPALPQADQAAARALLDLPDQAFVIGFFGSLRPYKGLDLLIEAFRQIQADCPDAHLLIAGKPDSPHDLPDLTGLERVHFTPGYIPHQQAWAYHLAADVMVFPYRHIYQSGALLTAMAYGLPVIATQVGSFPETIAGNGWLVEAENPPALAQAIRQAHQDRDQLAVLGQRSLALVATRYAPQVIAQQHLAVYRGLLTPPN